MVRSDDYDLTEPEPVRWPTQEPRCVIDAAAVAGGIGVNPRRPAEFFYVNAVMGIHLIHEACRLGVEKLVALGTVCSNPKFTPVPFREQNLWDAYPEETNAPYGLANKMLLVQLQADRQQ